MTQRAIVLTLANSLAPHFDDGCANGEISSQHQNAQPTNYDTTNVFARDGQTQTIRSGFSVGQAVGMQLDGSRVLVTGASRGIGESIARRCAQAGATVALAARDTEKLDALAASLGPNTVVCPIDLSEPAQVDGWIATVEDRIGGPIDVLINNAGLDMVGLLADKSADDVRRIHQVNLLSPIELIRQVLPSMVSRRSGHIVNVSSTAACGGFSGLAMYGSTKAGLSNFTRILRAELKGTGVETTVVSLGPVPTDMLATINEFDPARKAFRRFRRLQLMPNVDRDKVADAVIDAIRSERAHVRLPRRAAIYPAMAEFPQHMVNALSWRIPNRPR
jgi:uncharacterized protein